VTEAAPQPTSPAVTDLPEDAAPEPVRPTRPGWRRVAIDLRPLRIPAYRRIFIGTATSFFGAQFTAVAVPVQMWALTRSTLWVGYLGLAGLLPLLLFALWGGALADVFDRRRLLLVSSVVMWTGTLALFAQAVLHLDNRYLLLVLVGLQSGATAVTGPARAAIIPRIVPKEQVPQANTLSFTMSNASSVAGPLAAGLLIPYGLGWAYGVDAATFTLAMWAALRLPTMPPQRRAPGAPAAGLSDVLFGLRFIAATPILLLSFVVDIAAMVLAFPRALFPAVATDRFGGLGAVGWLYAAISIGSVLAGLTSGWVGRVRRQGLALASAVVVWGLAVAAAGLARSLGLAVLMLAVGGAADLVSAVFRQTILQTYAPDELRGRMQGVFTAVVAGGPRLGDLRAGLTAAYAGTTASWVGGGLAAATVATILAVTCAPLRRYRAE
jgi:MFS family permease